MTDPQMANTKFFLGYLELHGETERALVIGRDINRLLALAGNPRNYVRGVMPDVWYSLHTETSAPLIALARARLAEQPTATIILFPRRVQHHEN